MAWILWYRHPDNVWQAAVGVVNPVKNCLGWFYTITSSVNNFLSGVSWRDCSKYNEECVTIWTHLFAEGGVTYEPSIIDSLLSFVDYMSCSAETYSTLGGSNGCADQLTNWDGTKKLGLGSPTKKKGQSYWSNQSNKVESDLQQIVPASRSQLLKCNKKRRIMKSFYCISKFITIFVVKIWQFPKRIVIVSQSIGYSKT